MAITPPSERIWWKEPVHKVEIIWVIVAFLWGLAMFFTMIWWHGFGQQNMSNEAYRVQPFQYAEKVDKMIADHTVRQEGAFPVVRPPPGSDVYMMGRVYMWWPTACTSRRSTCSTAFRCSRSTSTSRCTPGMRA
jgi:cytochrome c oxidase subunit II